MECHVCGFDSLPGMSFCGMCGTRLATTCPDCGSVNPPNYRFCGICGRGLVDGVVRGEAPSDAVPAEVEHPVSAPAPPAVEPVRREAERVLPEPAPQASSAREVRLEGERRMATVILADVQGSTNLMEQIGTEAWVAMMNRVFHILESEIYRYGGTVDQFRGDGLVAFFGTTVAHEDDPERAVMASLAMQEAIGAYAAELSEKQEIDLRLRVGVNTGEVIVANIGDRTQHSEDTAMGEAIALASRMETAAEAGTVLVSENTYHLIDSRFDWKSLGEITVQGFSQPVAVYRPLAPRSDVQRTLRLETYGLSPLLVGRSREFDALMEYIDALRTGKGSIVLLTGEEGMGKSYLVSQVQQQALKDAALLTKARARGGAIPELLWLRGHCRSYEQSWPYSMWLDMLRRWLGAYDESRDATRDRLRKECETLWGEHVDKHYPYLAALLSLPLEEEFADWVEELDAESLRQQFFVTIRGWVEAMARRGPVVLTFDDVYWADATSLELLEYCLPLCDHGPIGFLLMFRLQRNSAVWEFHHHVATEYPHRTLVLTLDPLTETQSGEMIDLLIGAQTLPAGTRTQIVDRAEGNPYYIEEMIRTLVRDGILMPDGETGQWRVVRAVDSLDLPGTLRNLLLARIDDLAPEQRHVLQMASVIGVVFWTNVLQDLVGEECVLAEHLTALQRAQFVYERGRVPDLGTEYAFRSALIRDLACDSMLRPQRVTHSRQVADYLASLFGKEVLAQYYGVVAYQYQCAQEPRRELFYTLSAAEHAQGVYAHKEALQYYTRALELLDQLEAQDQDSRGGLWQDWRLESLKGLGKTCLAMGKVEEAEPYLRQAIAVTGEAESPLREQVRLYYWLCEALFWQGRYEEQIQLAEKGLSLLDDAESVEAALMNQELAVGHLASGRNAKFVEFTARTAQFLERLPYSEELRPAYDHVVRMCVYDGKDVDEAMRWLQIMEERATLHRDIRAVGEAYGHAGDILAHTGDLQGAVARYRLSLERYEQIGDIRHTYKALSDMADVLLSAGELDEANQCVDQILGLREAPFVEADRGWAHLHRGRILCASGNWEVAARAMEKAVEWYQEAGDPLMMAMAKYYLGRVYLLQGDTKAASCSLEEAATHVSPEAIEQVPLGLALLLTALENAAESDRTFRAFCLKLREQIPGTPLVQWFLEPADPGAKEYPLLYEDPFVDALPPDWTWQDPLDDCVLHVQEGLQIRAVNGRDLWHLNLSAPRVVRPVTGEWVAEVACEPVAVGRPSMGGLLVWQDKKNYLRLDYGSSGERGVMLLGCLDNSDMVIGRGLLPAEGTRAFLRLERSNTEVHALTSIDGVNWFSAGHILFPIDGPVQVGLYAIGSIDRMSFPGAHQKGTAIRFTSFRLWQTPLGGQENA